MEKIVLACLGKYLEEVGIEQVLVKNEVFGPVVAKQVMTGSHYIRSKRGMSIMAEALHRLYFSAFNESRNDVKNKELLTEVGKIQEDLGREDGLDISAIQERWELIENEMTTFQDDLKAFNEKGGSENCMFTYWVTFLFELYPVICDLTRSHREGNWLLHLSAVKRALPLFFSFNSTNYSRWVPMYYEDCLKLKEKFPLLHSNFESNGFVVRHTSRKGSGMPMDQALEKAYNKVSKGPGGVIGITKNKSAIARWNIIKHDKMLITQYLRDVCGLCDGDETSLHHEFSFNLTLDEEQHISEVARYIEDRLNPFKPSVDGKIVNIVTGKQLDLDTSEFLIDCIKQGKERYDEYKKDRLENKTKKLFDKIPHSKKSRKSSSTNQKIDKKKEIIAATRSIDYARLRQYNISSLLEYELTSIPFFLTKDGYLKKSQKYKLSKKIKDGINHYQPPVNLQETDHCTMTAIDFMAFARKVAIKK